MKLKSLFFKEPTLPPGAAEVKYVSSGNGGLVILEVCVGASWGHPNLVSPLFLCSIHSLCQRLTCIDEGPSGMGLGRKGS